MDFMKKAKDLKAKADQTNMDEKAIAKLKEMRQGENKNQEQKTDGQHPAM